MFILWRDPRMALLARVFSVHTAVMLVAVTFLVVTPLTVSWPLRPSELVELVAWSVVLLLTDYIALLALFGSRPNLRRSRGGDHGLTTRELEVVRLIASGHTAKEIAAMLFISPKTVDAHRGHILQKLGLRDRVALTRYAIKRGLIEP
jgi:DNA-binding CsgD family transcriptional regulator